MGLAEVLWLLPVDDLWRLRALDGDADTEVAGPPEA
jgi:hypothetical protein